MSGAVVTQADRRAAWPYRPDCYAVKDRARWMTGSYDFVPIIQAFARHRTAAEAAAKVEARALMQQLGQNAAAAAKEYAANMEAMRAAEAAASAQIAELVEALEIMVSLIPLLRLITIRQVIEAGEKAVDACGLNPWCINEGRATGSEPAIPGWKLESVRDLLARHGQGGGV